MAIIALISLKHFIISKKYSERRKMLAFPTKFANDNYGAIDFHPDDINNLIKLLIG